MTKRLFLEDTYQFHFEAIIQKIEKDERGNFIVLDKSAFYPQGGGQPSDHGIIKSDNFEIDVTHVVQLNNKIMDSEIIHYTTSQVKEIQLGSKVYCTIDEDRRLINARYHTAGHLLGNTVEILNPNLKAVKGHSFPNEAYVEFEGNDHTVNLTELQDTINEIIVKNYKTNSFEIDYREFEEKFYKLPYIVPDNKKFSAMQIGNMPPVPCGGTHIAYVGEIGNMKISKIKYKNNCVRISYDVI